MPGAESAMEGCLDARRDAWMTELRVPGRDARMRELHECQGGKMSARDVSLNLVCRNARQGCVSAREGFQTARS